MMHGRFWTTTNEQTALEVGQLVKDEYFTLFESIGAIEVSHFHISPVRL